MSQTKAALCTKPQILHTRRKGGIRDHTLFTSTFLSTSTAPPVFVTHSTDMHVEPKARRRGISAIRRRHIQPTHIPEIVSGMMMPNDESFTAPSHLQRRNF
jgi:hypothetical protein